MQQKKIQLVVGVGVLAALALGFFVYLLVAKEPPPPPAIVETPPPPPPPPPAFVEEVLGVSVEGREIVAHSFGTGETNVLFVGGMHGGYEWNTVVLSYELIDYLKANQNIVPENLKVTVIPNINPDGVYEVVGVEGRFASADAPQDSELTVNGRFNGNGVDLNRNFGCKWQPESTWRGNTVSAGSEAFSEPEALVLKDFVAKNEPEAVIFYHSQGNAVYGSECEAGILPETLAVMNAYAAAAQYEAIPLFDAYPITGDAEGWLASIGIPAITVELSSHEVIEREKNLAGVRALLQHYGK